MSRGVDGGLVSCGRTGPRFGGFWSTTSRNGGLGPLPTKHRLTIDFHTRKRLTTDHSHTQLQHGRAEEAGGFLTLVINPPPAEDTNRDPTDKNTNKPIH